MALAAAVVAAATGGLAAQTAAEAEVRQIVTFSFLPGKSAEALAVFREEALPLYKDNEAMLSFRGFREVESPVPLDLIVVSGFAGMAGMDDSNARLRELAQEAGTSIGTIYSRIGASSSRHTDEFVEMLPAMGTGDPSSTRLTALLRYRIVPGREAAFEAALATVVVPWEAEAGVPSETGRFLLSDGWHYLRFLGFDSLGAYQAYWSGITAETDHARVAELTVERRDVIVAAVPELSVR